MRVVRIMLLKIIFAIMFGLSLVYVTWYFIVADHTDLLGDTVQPSGSVDFGSGATRVSDKEYTRLPGSVAVASGKPTVDEAPVTNNTESAVVTDDFFELTDDESLYGVFYDGQSGYFTITLYGPDTAKARLAAETYIAKTLPYTTTQWCTFAVSVVTNEYENPLLTGLNLGLSFCPGSVAL